MSAIRPSTECATNGRIIIENKTSTIAASPKTSTAHNMILQATFITLTSRAVDRLVTSAVHCIYISRRISQSAARVPDYSHNSNLIVMCWILLPDLAAAIQKPAPAWSSSRRNRLYVIKQTMLQFACSTPAGQ